MAGRSDLDIYQTSKMQINARLKSKIIDPYFESTTIHGLGKIHQTKKVFAKLFWIGLFLTVSILLVRAIIDLIKRVYDYEINVSIETLVITEAMNFPSVTMYSTVPFSSRKTKDMKSVILKSDHDKYRQYVSRYWNISGSSDGGKVDAPHLDYFIYSCWLNSKTCTLGTSFKVESDWMLGKSYTFNHNKSIRLTQLRQGRTYGLSLVVYINQDDYDLDSPWLTASAGIIFDVYTKGQTISFTKGLMVAPGEYTRLAMRKSTIKRLPEPYKDNCTDGADVPLLFNGDYSTEGCILSCLIEEQLKHCGCIDPLLFSSLNFKRDLKLARSGDEVSCISKFNENFESGSHDCVCPPLCYEETYDIKMTHSDWPAVKERQRLLAELSKVYPALQNLSSEEMKNYFLAVDIYFDDFSVRQTVNRKGYVWDNLASDLGGQLGLWIGASMFSVMELGSFLFALLVSYFSLHRKDQKMKQDANASTPKLTVMRNENGCIRTEDKNFKSADN